MERDLISGCGRGYLPGVFQPTDIVRQIFERRAAGVSCEEIARRFNNLETGTGDRAASIWTILRRGQCDT